MSIDNFVNILKGAWRNKKSPLSEKRAEGKRMERERKGEDIILNYYSARF
jgi:hypothetical protein